jgi:uncharacterized protein YjiS (DUF1127 family)
VHLFDFVQGLVALLRACGATIGRAHAAWQRHRRAHATYQALSRLDAHTLRDLGLDRSELASVAAELTTDVAPSCTTRQRTQTVTRITT